MNVLVGKGHYELRVLLSSWGLAIDLVGRIQVGASLPKEAESVGDRTWITLPFMGITQDDARNLKEGARLAAPFVEAVAPLGNISIEIDEVAYVPTDYQPEALAAAVMGWLREAFELENPRVGIKFDEEANTYRFTYG